MRRLPMSLLSLSSLLSCLPALGYVCVACSSSDDSTPISPSSDAGSPDGSFSPDSGSTDGGTHRFVTRVVSFSPGPCAGFGQSKMPQVIEGPPVGGGAEQGSLDVVSLGQNGTIVLSFEPNAIVDGPGPDFIVFENAFYVGGNAQKPYAELGEVSVSEDGIDWKTYACTATSYPYGACAGWHPVYSAPGNGISPTDPSKAGGDDFDLADLGLTHARYVRIVDKATNTCASGDTSLGFDLDAISIANAEIP